MFPYLAILKLLLLVANNIANIVREKALLDAGEARATAKSLAAMADRLQIGQQLSDEIAAMSDSDLDAALRGDT